MNYSTLRAIAFRGAAALAVLGLFSACSDPNLINKTKYNGQSYVNTCETFRNEVQAILDANSGPATLRVSENDNSQFDYFYLEPGQFEQKGDTLYFRLINDLEYGKYLQKGVAVQVRATFSSQDHLADLEAESQGNLDVLVVNQAYWQANQAPFFVYKIPVSQKVNGKQVILNFSVVKTDKSGKVTKEYCNTVQVPLGPLDAPCCTDKPFEQAKPRSIVQMPNIDITPVSYKYKGFTGTLDLIFPMNSTKFERKELTNVIANYIGKYEAEGYRVRTVEMWGWASQGGTVDFNQRLSEARAAVVEKDLRRMFQESGRTDTVAVTSSGRGEDWERFELLVKTAAFSEEERNELLSIASSSDDADTKEAKLRKLKYWKKLVAEVLTYCRHTFITFTFDWTGKDGMVVGETYATRIPVISPELYNVATRTSTISAFRAGDDANTGLGTLNTIIDQNGFRTANLFAMRSTYHFANRDARAAISDMEAAQGLDQNNPQYGVAMLAYKTEYAGMYSTNERLKLLNTYNDYVARYPNDMILAYNRAVMMDRAGFISGALAEYDKLMGSNGKNAVALNNRGVARLKTNRVVEAEADFREALSLDANRWESHFNLAVVAAYKGLTDKAVQHLDMAISLNPAIKGDILNNPVFRVMKDNPKFAKYR